MAKPLIHDKSIMYNKPQQHRGSRAVCEALIRIASSAVHLSTMGLLSILKKMKQKEKDVRLLMLYPLHNFVV